MIYGLIDSLAWLICIFSFLCQQARSKQRSVRAHRVRFRDRGRVGRDRTLRGVHVRPQYSGPGRDKVDGLGTGQFPGVQVRSTFGSIDGLD